jgi:radical SAM superfamily enzyme YgiQ (UPF0313 family)
MHVTLIQPRLGISGVRGAMPPLAMGILARFTPKHVALSFIDESVEEIPADLQTDLVAMSVTTLTAKRAYTLSQDFRSRGIPVVMGGVHPTLLPDEALEHADSIVRGVGERVWPLVLDDALHGRLKRTYEGNNNGPMNGLTPDRTIYEGKKYAPLVTVQFGRGCRFACDFCSVHSFYGNTIAHRPVDEVIDELSSIREKFVFFVDDNLQSYGDGTLELFKRMARLGKYWVGQASINMANDPETVRLMKRSGCMGLVIGFESVDESSLGHMRKSVNIKSDYGRGVRLLQKNGIMIAGSFLFGYAEDDAASIDRAFRFALDNNFVHAYFNLLVPTPGTQVYSELVAKNRLVDERWWLSDDFRYGRIPFMPEGATAEELERACIAARRKFDSIPSIIKRGISSRTNLFPPHNLFIFWLANILYRAEYRRKYDKKIFV